MTHTFLCISCQLRPAVRWTGHVMQMGERVLAGFCGQCPVQVSECEDGCLGAWTAAMGVLEEEMPREAVYEA